MNIIDGKPVGRAGVLAFLEELPQRLLETRRRGKRLDAETVIGGCARLAEHLDQEEWLGRALEAGLGRDTAARMVDEALRMLRRDYLEEKLRRELGERAAPAPRTREAWYPLGVLTHIAAGNAAGLPAMSVIEGLLAGNINLLKLPGEDDGLSTCLLQGLLECQPELCEYVYVLDLPSTDVESIGKLLAVSDGVAVWGSDFAIRGIRRLAAPGCKLIEWGHKLSFAYVTPAGADAAAFAGIARDICSSEQLFCSSPQCVFYDTGSDRELDSFAEKLAAAMEETCFRYQRAWIPPAAQAEITTALRLAELEEIFGDKRRFSGAGFCVVADHRDSALSPSPMYRNIWVKKLPRESLHAGLQPRGYLQTAALACGEEEQAGLEQALLSCGVCRITPCGGMNRLYAGQPHDGEYALQRYSRRVSVGRVSVGGRAD